MRTNLQLTTLLLCVSLRAAAAFTPKSAPRLKCPALQAQQDDESRSRRGRRRERKKDAVAIDAQLDVSGIGDEP